MFTTLIVGLATGCVTTQGKAVMARLLAVDDVPVALRNSMLRHLTSFDEAVLLPQATQSADSSAFKNVTFRLCATQTVDPNLFPHDLFTGMSIVRISDAQDIKMLSDALADPSHRATLLKSLVNSTPSEMADENTTIGPLLDCGEDERDIETEEVKDHWTAGFDSTSCFVGIFSAQNSRPPDVGTTGQSRVHDEFFLVCKAGGGRAASTFHSRLRSELMKGKTLESCLSEEGTPGACALRRCASAGQRNRGQIMDCASRALGLQATATVGDQASRNRAKVVVPDVDVVVNTLRPLDNTKSRIYQLTCCTDLSMSKGAAWLSNATEGVTLLLSSSGDTKVSVNNDTFASLPFATPRTSTNRNLASEVLKAHKTGIGHRDIDWIKRRFGWKNAEVPGASVDKIEPFCFYGSHLEETFASSFSRELGISTLKQIHLRPELVVCAGVDPGKLRGIVRAL